MSEHENFFQNQVIDGAEYPNVFQRTVFQRYLSQKQGLYTDISPENIQERYQKARQYFKKLQENLSQIGIRINLGNDEPTELGGAVSDSQLYALETDIALLLEMGSSTAFASVRSIDYTTFETALLNRIGPLTEE